MKKNLIALATGAAMGLASLPASAGDVSGMTYVVAPMLHGVWVDRSRDVDDGMQYGLGMGRGVSDKWSVEAAIFKSDLDAPQETSFEMSGVSVSALRHFFPDSKASPFVSLGGGLIRVMPQGGDSANDPMLELGLGAMIDLFTKPDGSRKLLARPELKSRWQLQSGSDDQHDFLAGISFIFAFGPAHAPPPPPPAAEPEPPPPPPPTQPPPPADSDGDGVIDSADLCPDTPKGDRVGQHGCSCDVTVRVNFASDSAVLSDEAKRQLDQTIANLKRLQFVAGVAEGHTDNTASDAYNLQLSERRAKAVAEYIQAGGVAEGRLLPIGKGESDPVADNATREGRAENRRVVLRRTDCDQPQ